MINAAFILAAQPFADIYGEECVKAISSAARILGTVPTTKLDAENPPAWLSEIEVLFTGWGGPRLDAKMLAQMPNLRAVFYGAGTIRFVVTDACWERNLVITNSAVPNAIPTSEFAVGAILLSLKRAWQQARLTRELRAFPVPSLPIPGGCGSVIGLVSLGQVGRRVAERLRGMEVTLLAHDPMAPPSVFEELGLVSTSLSDLFARSDVVSLHTPLLPATSGFIDTRLLSSMKAGATFINTARGGLVQEPALINFLRARPDVQAIIDVTDPEPPKSDSPLYDLPNIFLTPHIAGSMGAERRRMGRTMVDEFFRYVRGEPLVHAVARQQLAYMA